MILRETKLGEGRWHGRADIRRGFEAIRRIVEPWYHHPWVETPLWSAVYLGRYVWRNLCPLIAPRRRDPVRRLRRADARVPRQPRGRAAAARTRRRAADPHAIFFVASMVVWALSTWYAMRLLSSTRFAADVPPHPAARTFARWANEELPRLGAARRGDHGRVHRLDLSRRRPDAALDAAPRRRHRPVRLGAWHRSATARSPRSSALHEREYPVQLAADGRGRARHGGRRLVEPARSCAAASPCRSSTGRRSSSPQARSLLFIPWWLGRPRRGATPQDEARMRAWRMVVDYGNARARRGVHRLRMARSAGGARLSHRVRHPRPAAFGLWLTSRRRDLLGMPEHPGIPHRAVKPLGGPFKLSPHTACAIAITLGALVSLTVGFAKCAARARRLDGNARDRVHRPRALVLLRRDVGVPAEARRLARARPAADPVVRCSSRSRPTMRCAAPRTSSRTPGGRGSTSTSRNGAKPRCRRRTARSSSSPPPAAACARRTGPRPCSPPRTTRPAASSAATSTPTRASRAARSASRPTSRRARSGRQKQRGASAAMRGRTEEIARMLGRDFLAPVAGSMLFAEHASASCLQPTSRTTAARRSRAPGAGLGRRVRPARRKGRFDRAVPRRSSRRRRRGPTPVRPAVFLNATGVDSGPARVATNVARARLLPGIDRPSAR